MWASQWTCLPKTEMIFCNSCFLHKFSGEGLQKWEFPQGKGNVSLWYGHGAEEQTPWVTSSWRVMTNVWTLLQITHTWFMERITCRRITAHVFQKHKFGKNQSAHRQITKRGRGKYSQTNLNLEIIHSAQFTVTNFYGSRSLWSRR